MNLKYTIFVIFHNIVECSLFCPISVYFQKVNIYIGEYNNYIIIPEILVSISDNPVAV